MQARVEFHYQKLWKGKMISLVSRPRIIRLRKEAFQHCGAGRRAPFIFKKTGTNDSLKESLFPFSWFKRPKASFSLSVTQSGREWSAFRKTEESPPSAVCSNVRSAKKSPAPERTLRKKIRTAKNKAVNRNPAFMPQIYAVLSFSLKIFLHQRSKR